MRSFIATLIFSSAIAPGIAFAGTCAAPTPGPPLPPDSATATVTGTTCGGEAGINMGGTIYNHPSQVYVFKAGPLNQFFVTGTDREMSVTTSCTSAPIASGGPGVPLQANLVSGATYLLIVSSDPSIPQGASPVCGNFAVTGTFPVSLQAFSVD